MHRAMTRFALRAAPSCAGSLCLAPLGSARRPHPPRRKTPPVVLVPHRAIYDLTLGETRGNSQIAGVRGRILYDFDGNACQGYSLEFRQVSELDTGEGKMSTSDLRSTTWEDGRRQELQIHLAELRRRKPGRYGRRPCRARRRARPRSISTKPQHEDPRSRRRGGVSDRAHGARHRGGARRQEHSRFPGL